jgi:hypothetical protein
MSDLSDQLGSLTDTLQVHSPNSFTILGVHHETQEGGAVLQAGSVLSGEARERLAEILYATLHCRKLPGSAPADWVAAREFMHGLSAANAGTGTWQSGWVIRGFAPDGEIVAEKHGIRFWVPSRDFRPSRTPLQVGGHCWVKVPEECYGLLPGFYLALADPGEIGVEGSGIVRVYWHLWSGGAAPLVASLTRELNRQGVPFELKLLADPAFYPRADGAVLYLSAGVYRAVVPLLSRIHLEVRSWLRGSVSAFAKRIAHGVGLAEDPGEGSSFGQHRSALLADELAKPESLAADSGPERCRAVLTGLQRKGWAPEALYLNRGSTDAYPLLAAADDGAD